QSLPSRLVLACQDIGIRQVVYRTENAGGTMADGFARISGQVGVVCAQNGPAATLLVPPLAEALKVSIPIVALVQEVPRDQTDRNAFQEIDHHTLFSSCTKWTKTIRSADRVDDYLRQAFMAATTGRPGPAVLMLPADLLDEEVEPSELPDDGIHGGYPLDRTVADPRQIEAAAKLIAEAKAPIVVAGGGVHGSGACGELSRLQNMAQLPVATTMMGKGSVDESHPLSLGLVGNVMGDRSSGKHLRRLIDEADIIFLIGNRTNQNGTDTWQLFPETARIIHLDVDGQEIARNYPGLRLVSDAKLTLEHLCSRLESTSFDNRVQYREAVEQTIAQAKAKRDTSAASVRTAEAIPIRPERIMAELDRIMPPEAIVVADASYSSVWINSFLTSKRAGSRFLTPRGLAGLGWGLPLAIGAKLAAPERSVVCVVGDGGFGHVWSELETMVREDIAITLLVLNNGTLGYQKDAEHVKFGRHTRACYFGTVNHATVATACNCANASIRNPAELKTVLLSALQSNEPFLIDIHTDPQAYPPLTMYDGTLEEARQLDTELV
ncbi:MAG: acetolactate synthase catalytic subunit, partial [Phycisphaerales bacterium]|nr:acetolactate synthase catalytic subunit [Phycisphaerales bacterium]